MTSVPQLEQNRQVYSVEGADVIIRSVREWRKLRVERLRRWGERFPWMREDREKAKSKAPHVGFMCGAPKFVSGFIVRATRRSSHARTAR